MPLYIGTSNDDSLVGSGGPDVIVAYSGDDTLDDGGGGPDELIGGSGNDTYIVRDARDSIIELANEGIDMIRTSLASFTLRSNFENLLYFGLSGFTGRGNTLDNVIIGGVGDDQLFGFDGRDTLIGGAGNDYLDGGAGLPNQMQGGAGDDVYIVSAEGDTIVEFSGDGIDIVRTANSVFRLPANVEGLVYTEISSFLGIGNNLDNGISGGPGNDYLIGGGGNDVLVGAGDLDTLQGGVGDDIYYADRGDTIIEFVGEGIDAIFSNSPIYVLPANIEILQISGSSLGSVLFIGNDGDNSIFGGRESDSLFGREGNDTIFGGPGAANTMLGQEGDDLYVVEAAGDTVIEFANQGVDRIETAIASFTLRDNVENLAYTGTSGFIGIGNADANTIHSGVGADVLSGLDGNDILIGGGNDDLLQGGAGADQFRYLGVDGGLDRILDFVSGTDKIALSLTGFNPTSKVEFVSGSAPVPTNTNSTILYNVSTGIISYDRDGAEAGVAIPIAQLNAGQAFVGSDFIFF